MVTRPNLTRQLYRLDNTYTGNGILTATTERHFHANGTSHGNNWRPTDYKNKNKHGTHKCLKPLKV